MKFALIGAELPGLDVHSNYQRTSELRNELIKKGLSFVGVQNISANKKFQLFLVTFSREEEIISLAKIFGQKAVLISDESKNMEVVSTKTNGRTFLGKFVATTKAAAGKAKFYVTFEENGTQYYYIANKQGVNSANTTGTRIQSTY